MQTEALARDFMLGAVSPIMRQHGNRDTRIWAPGWSPAATKAATEAIRFRSRFGDYIHEQLAVASATGVALNRYLWHDFPEDPVVWGIRDEFMFGSDYLVAPIVEQNATNRSVYFPRGVSSWLHHTTGAAYEGGSRATVDVPLDDLALFRRRDAKSRFPVLTGHESS